MKVTRYYAYLVLLVVIFPYGWGMPRYFPFLVPVSVGTFLLGRWALLRFEQARSTSQVQATLYFVAAACVMFGHTALIGVFIEK
jgi:hypothetical protein